MLARGDLKQSLTPESTAIFDFSGFVEILEKNSETFRRNWLKQAEEAPQQDEHMASAESPLL
jgi:hypothetical protein